LDNLIGFDWDEGNKQKNWEKHQVDYTECEQAFFNKPLLLSDDTKHSSQEKRYYALGRSDAGRALFLAFTTRNNKIRVISAREQRKKTKDKYMNSKRKPVPQFNSEDDEREFWATHDSTEYIEWSKAERNPTLSRLKPSTRTISIRLPESLIAELKALANKRDVPYQSLVKIYLSEKVKEETTPYLHSDPD
jgi:uncharacterized DUF497 family protein